MGVHSPYMRAGSIASNIQKLWIILPLLLQINVLNFKMIGLKFSLLGTTASNFVPYRCIKEIENFKE